MELLYFIIIGGIAGWLAGLIVKGSGQGILINVVVGIIGAFIGGWLLGGRVIIFDGLLNSLLIATIGAIILLIILNLVRRAR